METSPTSSNTPETGTKVQVRARKLWVKSEDEILRQEAEVLLEQDGITNVWSRIAAKLPGRTNKDCRKRWMKVCKKVNKGAWVPAEDQRLIKAVRQHGQSWIQVAQEVKTRHADQCAKRWQQSLDPSIVHTRWQSQDDERLLAAVNLHGRKWKTIADTVFLGRSTTDLKNRHAVLTKGRQINSANSNSNSVSRDSTPESACDSTESMSDAGFDPTDIDLSIPDVDNKIGDLFTLDGGLDDLIYSNPYDYNLQPPTSAPATLNTVQTIVSEHTDITTGEMKNPTFSLNSTPHMDMQEHDMKCFPWTSSVDYIGQEQAMPQDAQQHQFLHEETMRNLCEPSRTTSSPLRRSRSRTTLVLEDVDSRTLSRVIEILTAGKTKMKMDCGGGDDDLQ